MKKHRKTAVTFYILGTIAALYVGVFLFIIKPIYELCTGYTAGTLTTTIVILAIVKIILSGTVGGFIWCIGYSLFNHFMGTEDPNWDELNPIDEFEEITEEIKGELKETFDKTFDTSIDNGNLKTNN